MFASKLAPTEQALLATRACADACRGEGWGEGPKETTLAAQEGEQVLGEGVTRLDVRKVRRRKLHQLRTGDARLHEAAVGRGGDRVGLAADNQGWRADPAQLLAEVSVAHRRAIGRIASGELCASTATTGLTTSGRVRAKLR